MKRTQNQKGYTLIESIMFIGVITAVSIGIINVVSGMLDRYKISRLTSQVAELQKSINVRFAASENYKKLTAKLIKNENLAHSTIAGVLVAFSIPSTPLFEPKIYIRKIRNAISNFHAEDDERLNKRTILTKNQMDWLKQVESASDKVISPLQDLEDSLHPIVNFVIIPFFAFANAGISMNNIDITTLFEGVSLAVMCALMVGKVVGIFSFSWLVIKMNIAPMPQYSNWKMLMSVALLGGIGFTVSMFIANLSFGSIGVDGLQLLNQSKLGIIVGSIASGLLGYIMLRVTLPKRKAKPLSGLVD